MAILNLQELHILQEYHCKPSKNVVHVVFVLCNILLIAVYNEEENAFFFIHQHTFIASPSTSVSSMHFRSFLCDFNLSQLQHCESLLRGEIHQAVVEEDCCKYWQL